MASLEGPLGRRSGGLIGEKKLQVEGDRLDVTMAARKLRLGISACLLGENVRYDGGHKLDPLLVGLLSEHTELVPVCPEVECGLGVPREPMRLTGSADSPGLVAVATGTDYARQMVNWTRGRLAELDASGLHGFILKSRSPSCAPSGIQVHAPDGAPTLRRAGVFAHRLAGHFPLLPMSDDARLHCPSTMESFVTRVVTVKRWGDEVAPARLPGSLVRFHERHRLLAASRARDSSRGLEEMVRLATGPRPPLDIRERYLAFLLNLLTQQSLRARNATTLDHIAACLRPYLNPERRREIREALSQYRDGDVPLGGPVSLLSHHADASSITNLEHDVFLHPHPLTKLLRDRL